MAVMKPEVSVSRRLQKIIYVKKCVQQGATRQEFTCQRRRHEDYASDGTGGEKSEWTD